MHAALPCSTELVLLTTAAVVLVAAAAVVLEMTSGRPSAVLCIGNVLYCVTTTIVTCTSIDSVHSESMLCVRILLNVAQQAEVASLNVGLAQQPCRSISTFAHVPFCRCVALNSHCFCKNNTYAPTIMLMRHTPNREAAAVRALKALRTQAALLQRLEAGASLRKDALLTTLQAQSLRRSERGVSLAQKMKAAAAATEVSNSLPPSVQFKLLVKLLCIVLYRL
jgi:hypothetical protein